MKRKLPIGSIWEHRKTEGRYVVIMLSIRESDLELLVNYRSVSSPHETPPWCRPASEFLDGRFRRML